MFLVFFYVHCCQFRQTTSVFSWNLSFISSSSFTVTRWQERRRLTELVTRPLIAATCEGCCWWYRARQGGAWRVLGREDDHDNEDDSSSRRRRRRRRTRRRRRRRRRKERRIKKRRFRNVQQIVLDIVPTSIFFLYILCCEYFVPLIPFFLSLMLFVHSSVFIIYLFFSFFSIYLPLLRLTVSCYPINASLPHLSPLLPLS